ncbi:hypothetical protein DICPUDRAFT_81100 [Dictyostelium purpureum]|uniref:Sas10 C-terminal domain-containing protein n=1 Tax=Dictyostelium purpureum TaxID=5786 RepID=F0ZSH3_DICPU|nr:uncharacterized protein DICPUDRAFT_81100 [Dictyostelium purpureum]EGC33089.1 hypothetical protein DICPUDRAFT_81100 [Dictyostelium purpureum]|eukprot:XP_003290366.1 hypothetical protein DICPUDRAFT_81100 [Dictyostelium purpureum]
MTYLFFFYKKRKLTLKKKSVDELYGKSDIDAFKDKKTKVDLSLVKGGKKNNSKQQKKQEEEEEKYNIGLDISDEEVENFDSDQDDFEAEDFDDDEDDEIIEKKTKKKNLDLENKLAWGKKKEDFYGRQTDAKDVGSDEEDEEEEEAKEVEKFRKQSIKDEDYQDDQSFKNLINKKNNNKTTLKPEEKMLQSLNSDLNSIDFGSKNSQIEKLEKDISNFTKKEKLQYLITESPLLLELLEDFKIKMNEIKTSVLPALEKVKNNEIPTNKGISFLETKYQLLLSYCLNITYFLMLKSSGSSIKDHPVIDQIVKCRTMLEKIQPLDKKLKYQVDKLLKSANTGSLVGASKDDPLQYKPNLSAIDGEEGSDDGEADDQDEDGFEFMKNGVYQAPRLYGSRGGLIDTEDIEAKKKSKDIRDKKRAIKSSMARELDAEYGDQPAEEYDYFDGGRTSNGSVYETDAQKEVRDYEESNFTRLQLSKKEIKNMKSKQKRMSDGLDDLADFSEINGLIDTEEDKENKENQAYLQKKRMQAALNSVSQLNAKKRIRSTDEDVPLADNKNKKLNTRMSSYDDDDEIESEDEEEKVPEFDGIPKTNFYNGSEETAEGSKRKINNTIEKNRGLTRYRPRETRTPHLKNRVRYEKATKRRGNQISKAERKDTNYTGVKNISVNARKAQPYLS